MKDKHLFVKNVSEISSRHGGHVFKIELIDLDTTEQYHTYADPNNFNYKHWEPIIKHQDNGFIITNCKLKKDDQVDADSKVEYVMELTGKQAIERISQHIDEQRVKYNMPKSQMDLFDFGG